MNGLQAHVKIGGGYDILIASGLISKAGQLLKNMYAGRTCAVITDTNVEKLYLSSLLSSLESAGIRAHAYAFQAGESSKNMDTLSDILEFMAKIPLTRTDFAIALGGGVTGDMTGFASGCYMRGIDFVQIPTTYLAAVDSSVGGKTAVNLKSGKNLAGLFYQPKMVLIDTDTLRTLSKEDYASGIAEAVKMGVITDKKLFSLFESGEAFHNEKEVIFLSVFAKAEIVDQDEREGSVRKLLNLGHTYGHAIEKLSDYTIPHGHAVAIGLAMAVRTACRMGDMEKETAEKIINVLKKYGLPTESPFAAEAMADASMNDKKRAGASLSIIVPKEIGKCEIRKIPAEEFIAYIRMGSEEI
ncbi:MAG: 3-dehydroquinate synthase [Clostridia bacterium]|nr:3-dehydroquinate synthase [Clostridia bacterium]MBQ4156984.1 3-dehydroquinate synthase [Clostridia bacterium]